MNILYCWGDSITLGVEDQEYAGWPARLAVMLMEAGVFSPPDTLYNLGVRKNSSAMIAQRWKAEYEARRIDGCPAFFLFSFGTVDMATPRGSVNVPIGESSANARDILEQAKLLGKALLISPPPVRDAAHSQRLEALCLAYSSICKDIGMPFADIFHQLNVPAYIDDLADGVHPGIKGNRLIAHALTSPVALLLGKQINS